MTTQEPIVDLDELLANLGGDEQLANQLLERIRQDLPQRLASLRDALERGDTAAAHQCSHPIKGALASVRAVDARQYAEVVDNAAREDGLDTARAALPELEAAVERLQAFIEQRLAD